MLGHMNNNADIREHKAHAMAAARRRLGLLKVTAATLSLLSFSGLSFGIAAGAISTEATATASASQVTTTTSTNATVGPAAAATSSTGSASSSASSSSGGSSKGMTPIVTAQS